MAKAQLKAVGDDFVKPSLGEATTNGFTYNDRATFAYQNGLVVDYQGEWSAREMEQMLCSDYRAQQIEKVLALPVVSASWDIVSADKPKVADVGPSKKAPARVKSSPTVDALRALYQSDELDPNTSATSLDKIIGQATTAFSLRRAFWEKTWIRGTGDFAGKFVYGNVGFRPQTTCRILRNPRTGAVVGFEQDPFTFDPTLGLKAYPIRVLGQRAMFYIHNQRLSPMAGTSDLDVALWAWRSKQKLLFLWFQFLEGVSLPRAVVTAADQETANRVARDVARLKNSGVIPVSKDGSAEVSVAALDISGKGSEEFTKAIAWLDNAATDAVLAGFLNLTGGVGNEGKAGGSLALAKDASDFFLQNEEAKTREIEDMIRQQLFAPLVRVNYGPGASVPRLKFEPLNTEDKSASVTLLQALLAGRDPQSIPTSFIAALAAQVANYIGLDASTVENDFQKAADEAKAQAQQMQQQIAQGGNAPVVSHVAAASGIIKKASDMVKSHKQALAQDNQDTTTP